MRGLWELTPRKVSRSFAKTAASAVKLGTDFRNSSSRNEAISSSGDYFPELTLVSNYVRRKW